MNKLLLYVLLALCVIMTIKNFRQLKQSKVESEYLKAYKALIDNDPNTLELINTCINESKNVSEIYKAHILKLIEELKQGEDYSETLNKITVENLFYRNGKLDDNLVLENSDAYVWLIAAMVKAYSKNRNDVIANIYDKFMEHKDELANNLEFNVFVGAHNALLNEGDHDILRKLVEGEYSEFKYDKRVVGAYKRITGILMYHAKDEMDEYLTTELKEYSKAKLGSYLLEDLGYAKDFEEEVVEEAQENEEPKE